MAKAMHVDLEAARDILGESVARETAPPDPAVSGQPNKGFDLAEHGGQIGFGGRDDVLLAALMLVMRIAGESALSVMAGIVVAEDQSRSNVLVDVHQAV
jgi:hypothetical protein